MTTVLVVEDDHDLLEAVCTTLELAGFPVLGAADGASALELMAERDIGLVLSAMSALNLPSARLWAATRAV